MFKVGGPGVLSVVTWRMGVGEEEEAQEGGDIYVYNYGSFVLLYGRNQHNIVKQFSSNLKINKKDASEYKKIK